MGEDVTRDELAEERSRLATELADAKRKFMAVAKRKQQEYSKKVLLDCLADHQAILSALPAGTLSAAALSDVQCTQYKYRQPRLNAHLSAPLKTLVTTVTVLRVSCRSKS